jgi:hypothetical protein
MIVETIYERLKEHDRKLSKSKFCTKFLCKSRNYWCCCNNMKREISNDALISLYGTLRTTSNVWEEISRENNSGASERYLAKYKSMMELAEMALGEIERRAIA